MDQGQFSVTGPKAAQLRMAIHGHDDGQGFPGLKRQHVQPHIIGEMLYVKGTKPLMETGRISQIRGAPLFKGGTFNHLLPSLIQLVCDQME